MSFFALNHMTIPNLDSAAFLKLASKLGCIGVEFRNDLEAPLFFGTEPEVIKDMAADLDIDILALAEVKAFNDFSQDMLLRANELMQIAVRCHAQAISLIPRVGGAAIERVEQQKKLRSALIALMPLLEEKGLVGLIEPIGFTSSTLRYKEDVVDVIEALDAAHCFKLLHDTFHHHLAGGGPVFAGHTGLVHVSGVCDPKPTMAEMQDHHRGFVDADDRLENIAQLKVLRAQGYAGAISFEAFSPEVHSLSDPKTELLRSFGFITSHLADLAA